MALDELCRVGLPAPTAVVSCEDNAPQATDSISTRTPGCVRSNSAPMSFKTATAFGSTAVCHMRSVVCCCCCFSVQDEPITTDRARRNTKHRAITTFDWFCISIPPPWLCFAKSDIWKRTTRDYILYQLTLAQWFSPNAIPITFLPSNQKGASCQTKRSVIFANFEASMMINAARPLCLLSRDGSYNARGKLNP